MKILPNEAFGYRTVVVDQPLRAHWEIREGTWDAVEQEKAFAKVGEHLMDPIAQRLRSIPRGRFADEATCIAAITKAITFKEVTPEVERRSVASVAATMAKKVLAPRCLVRHSEDDPVTDKSGNPVADTDRRDTEDIPLHEEVEAYLDREVRPHVPGAWCSDPCGRVGYEIPLTRLFYRFSPPRPSEEIKAELREREKLIRELLEEVLV